MPKVGKGDERFIGKLHPSIRGMARRLLIESPRALIITDGLRDDGRQAALYAQGRTAPGKIVTYAPAGSSWHNFGLAFDVAVWNGTKATWPNNVALWTEIGLVGEAIGLTWGGRFLRLTDLPHFEYHPGITLAQAREGKRPCLDG